MRFLHHRITVAFLMVGLSGGTVPAAAGAMYSAPFPSNMSLTRPAVPEPVQMSTPRITSLSRLVNQELAPASGPSSTNLCAELCVSAVTASQHVPAEQSRRVFAGSRPANVASGSARNSGFDWSAAGIGAGACLMLLGIGLAGTRTTANGRKRHPAEQHTIATR
jgi:hypothetical protein